MHVPYVGMLVVDYLSFQEKIVCSVCICISAWQVQFSANCRKFPPPTYNVWYLTVLPIMT